MLFLLVALLVVHGPLLSLPNPIPPPSASSLDKMEVFSLPLPGIHSAAVASKHSLTHKHGTLTL